MPEVKLLSQRYDVEDAHTIEGYERTGGWKNLRRAFERSPEDNRNLVKDSGLRGRGGAGFPTGLKWSFVPQDTGKPIYLVVNADEGEPGTFKDRELMERDPFSLVEGIIASAYALNSPRSFIFIRGEYVFPGIRVEEAIHAAHKAGWLGKNIMGTGFSHHITLHYGAGAYICGEETALLEALEGRRGQPRLRPPFPAVAGLYASPTVINNVESVTAAGYIMGQDSPDWYKQWGTEKAPGTKLMCISGELNRPGNYEIALGMTARDVIEELGGGVVDGRPVKFWAPGGSSTPILTADHLDVGMDYESIAEAGSMMGTGALMVYSDRTSVVEAGLNWLRFYEHESCGKCTPCRDGGYWMGQTLQRIRDGRGTLGDIDLLVDQSRGIKGRSFCALADGFSGQIPQMIKYFRNEFVELVENGRVGDHIVPHVGAVVSNAQADRPNLMVGTGNV